MSRGRLDRPHDMCTFTRERNILTSTRPTGNQRYRHRNDACRLCNGDPRPREHRLVILYTCRAVRGNLGSTAYGATGRLTRPMEHTSIDERRPAIRDGWKTHRIVQAGGSRALVQGRVSELRIPTGTTAFGAINYLKNVQRTTTIGANLADYVNGTFCHVLISRTKKHVPAADFEKKSF